MRRFFLDKLIDNELVEIKGDQFLHMSKVLRFKEGDKFIAICGDKKEYICQIKRMDFDKCISEVLEQRESQTDALVDVTVFQACVKGDKFDLIIQKLSELGVSKIIPFDSDFSIAKCQEQKTERYNKIASEACKQCRRTIPLIVEKPLKFSQIISKFDDFDLILFCNEHEDALSIKSAIAEFSPRNVALIIGSEGGFSPREIDTLLKTKAKSITLGKRILRAETAAIVSAACVMLELGELG